MLDKDFRKRGLPKRRRRKLPPHNLLRPKNVADGSFSTDKAYPEKFRNSKTPRKQRTVDSG